LSTGSERGRKAPEGLSDPTLVRRVREGDEGALEVLLRRYSEKLRRQIERSLPRGLRRRVSVTDVLQETCIAAIRRLPDFEHRGDGSLEAWLRRIAELKVLAAAQRHGTTAKRAAGREVTRGERPDTAEFVAGGPSPSEGAVASELAERARETMAALKDDYRRVLRLAIEEHLPLPEVAQRMGRSPEAVRKLYGRALARFTRLLFDEKGGRHE
jgi:RNA polymerase sigma-70 factor (ECF subfamily)